MDYNNTRPNKPPDETKDKSTTEQLSDGRAATINTDRLGVPIGIAVWLNADELVELGVDPEANDVVGIQVTNGELKLRPVQEKGPDSSDDANASG